MIKASNITGLRRNPEIPTVLRRFIFQAVVLSRFLPCLIDYEDLYVQKQMSSYSHIHNLLFSTKRTNLSIIKYYLK